MYCEDNEGTDIDHFRPKGVFPILAFAWPNYLLACSRCNSNAKRQQFPQDQTGRPLLIDPTDEDPMEHLTLSLSTGEFVASTAKGDASIQVFGLNRGVLQEGRRDAWIAMRELLPAYAAAHAANDLVRADEIGEAVRRFPFSAVLRYLLANLALPAGVSVVPPDVEQAVLSRAEIATWV